MKPEAPRYTTTKQALWISSGMAWVVILVLAIGAAADGKAVEFGTICVPSMVAVILGILGIHRVTGSLDMRAMSMPPSPPPFDVRDDTQGERQ